MIATLKDLAKVLVAKHQLKQRDAEFFVSAVVDTILEGLQADRIVKIKGFGTFKLTAVRDRESVNVNTGERIIVSGHDKISFTPDSVMRDMVNKPFAHFDTVLLADNVNFDDIQESEIETEPETENEHDEEPFTVIEEVNVAVDVQEQNGVIEDQTEGVSEPVEAVVGQTEIISEQADETSEQADETSEQADEASEQADEISEQADEIAEQAENVAEPTEDVADQAKEIIEQTDIIQNEIENTMEEIAGKNPEQNVVEEESVLETSCHNDNEKQNEQMENKEEKEFNRDERIKINGFYVPTDDDDNDDDDDDSKKFFLLYALISNILIAAIAFVLGYLCCSNNWITFGQKTELVPEQEPVEIMGDSASMADVARIDSIKKAAEGPHTAKKTEEKKETAKEETDKKTEQKAPEQKVSEQKQQSSTAKQSPSETVGNASGIPDQTPYIKNVRVRTGAYYIVGTQATITVREGQTLQSISKRYLGEGMECYVEVYNGGLSSVREGQTIKIPKLQLKKSVKK